VEDGQRSRSYGESDESKSKNRYVILRHESALTGHAERDPHSQ